MRKVDTHAHIFSADVPAVADARYQPQYSATVQDYIEHLDQHGFDYGVLIQPSFLGVDNSQMLAAIAAYPDRLKGIAVVPPEADMATLSELKAQGIVGARLNLFGKAVPDLTQTHWARFLAQLEQLEWQLELHCPPAYLQQMMPALQRHQGDIVLDHLGRIEPDLGVQDPAYQAVLDALDPERFWFKVSGHYRLGQAGQGQNNAAAGLQALLDRQLAHRLVWGSDWPHTQHEQDISYDATVAFMEQLIDDAALKEQVLSRNALLLFDFKP